jgi:PEGA domain-containing protein
LLFLYNSGARVSEATFLQIADLNLHSPTMSDLRLMGKGRKTRRCPLWPDPTKKLLELTRNRPPDQPVFLNRLGQAITRSNAIPGKRPTKKTAGTYVDAPSTGMGSISITSAPEGGEVFVNSIGRGKAPSTVKLSAGSHAIQIVMTGYKDWTSSVVVKSDAVVDVMANLEK